MGEARGALGDLVIDPNFWSGKRVLVTGHTGFKGSWLCLWLQSMGAQVSGFALEPLTQPSLFTVADVGRDMTSIIGDVTDIAALGKAFTSHRPEIVFHLAAQSIVRASYEEPVSTYATNVGGTVNLLESIRLSRDVRSVVVVTSDKCYENREWCWGYRENEALGGYDPYSSSKACAELVTAAYRSSYFRRPEGAGGDVSVATARAGNVIGGGDWTRDRLIPDLLRAITESRPVVIRYPSAVRPWQHVLEPLGGYLILAQRLFTCGQQFAEAWNFGPSNEDSKPVSWIVQRLADEWGKALPCEMATQEQPHEAGSLRLDISKSRTRLEWAPRWNLATALRRIVDWHKAHLAGEEMRRVALDQIRAYIASPVPSIP